MAGQGGSRSAQHDAGDLIASAAAGDEYAFRRIIAAHHDDMRRVCSHVAGDRAIADGRAGRVGHRVEEAGQRPRTREAATLAHGGRGQRGEAAPP